jgi:hypothetical protein
VIWAFTHEAQGNYVPLTWISHMLNVELFGLDAGRHHTVNALLHLLTALLLFEALRRMTGAPAPSAFVALFFAVHPTHVESVAWVAERRDTLSAFFWMLTLDYGLSSAQANIAWIERVIERIRNGEIPKE